MSDHQEPAEAVDTLVIGGGQAGLSVGYHLARRDLPFLIVDDRPRVGDAWRERWDSLRLFTPAAFDGLDGMPFPARSHTFPTKDEMADYLEGYAAAFDLPVRSGARVERLVRQGDRFVATAGGRRIEARNVVVAMSSFQSPWTPAFSRELRSDIVQLHSADYRDPGQLRDGPVLLVGAGNSGSEIAVELAPDHRVWMSGRDVGQVPFRIDGRAARMGLVRLVLRGLFHRVLTVDTPMGRHKRTQLLHSGGPLVRVKRADLARLGVERVPRTDSVRDGLPVLEDGRVLEPANVVWCTGFRPGFDWIEGMEGQREPAHRSGVAEDTPGLYFVGLHFLHAFSSAMIHGVGRDAARIARHIADRSAGGPSARSRGASKTSSTEQPAAAGASQAAD